jgi:hypothetical protein
VIKILLRRGHHQVVGIDAGKVDISGRIKTSSPAAMGDLVALRCRLECLRRREGEKDPVNTPLVGFTAAGKLLHGIT